MTCSAVIRGGRHKSTLIFLRERVQIKKPQTVQESILTNSTAHALHLKKERKKRFT